MEGMGNGDGHSMGATSMNPPPSDMPMSMGNNGHGHGNGMIMHMTFFWGKDALILFSSWPGNAGIGMYLLSLLFIFFLAALAEALVAFSSRVSQSGLTTSNAFILTTIHALKMGVLYLVMLAVMSFNVGVFLATVAGHAVGFFF
jgi:solute carrier family 31 (copper transporter), member 1